MIYCFVITCWIPNFIISKVFGKKTPEAQRAWREKMGIVFLCALFMGVVGFITFGFTQTVCGRQAARIKGGQVNNGSIIVNGYAYELASWTHPSTAAPLGTGMFNGSNDPLGVNNPLYMENWMAGGKDLSFMFQTNVNKKCHGILTAGPKATGTADSGKDMSWYFPCTPHDQNTTLPINATGYDSGNWCHLTKEAREDLEKKRSGTVFYSWDQIKSSPKNLTVYRGSVLDFSLLQWLDQDYTQYPAIFDTLKNGNATFTNRDATMLINRAGWDHYGECLNDIVRVGFVDSKTIGCVASDIVLYVSLVFILGAVVIKFLMALYFGWFLSWRMGNFANESYQDRMKRAEEIENWTDDIYKAAPGYLRPNARDTSLKPPKKGHFFPTQSRYSKAEQMMVNNSRPGTLFTPNSLEVPRRGGNSSVYGASNRARDTPPGSPLFNSHSSTSLPFGSESVDANDSSCPWPLTNVIPQPGPEFEPFGYPLVHTLCLVTAYSESIEGLRTTLDSIATTDYPNSHKLILVVCDGMVRGSGSKQYTPDIVLSMMKELVIPEEEVEAHSYVAIADGHKRHNMAKVYAGFYAYDDDTVEPSKQQRIPIVLVAKTGNPLERNDAKPGNRGKRDSQIVIMAFLQKVMFDERMTTMEYEFFNAIWRCTGVTPDKYETVLCVDADTKVFPDSLSRMNACMVNDTEIMGLCGETKIANKRETWVTMIQGE
jgi:chitin synthase